MNAPLRFVACLLVACLGGGPGLAQPVPPLRLTDSLRAEIPLRGHLLAWRQTGPGHLAAVVDSLRRGAFRPLPTNWLRGADRDAPYWFALSLRNEGRARSLWLVVAEDVQLLELYQREGPAWRRRHRDGMLTPFARRTVPNKHFPFPLTLQPGERAALLLKAHNPTRFFVARLELWDAVAFTVRDHTEYFRAGMLAGFVLITALFSLFCLLTLRDRAFGYYAGYILSAAVVLLGNEGLTAEYLWPDAPRFTLHERSIFVSLTVGLQVLFVGAFVGREGQPVRFRRAANAFAWLCLALAALRLGYYAGDWPLTPGLLRWVGRPVFEFTLLGYFVSIVAVVGYQCWLGNRYAWYYAGVHAVFLVVLVAQTLSRLKVISGGIFLESFTVAVVVEVIALALGLAYRYHDHRRQRQRLEASLSEAKSEIIRVEETERQRLAQDLHDDLGQTLATARHALERLPATGADELRQLLEKASRDLRQISHNLMPVEFERFGLAGVLADTVRKLSDRTDLEIRFARAGEVRRLDPRRELTVFRIASELLGNALRHAEARGVFVQLTYRPDGLSLTVEDDGTGISPKKNTAAPAGIGLRSVLSRAQYIGASLTTDTGPWGTLHLLEIPYDGSEHDDPRRQTPVAARR